MEIIQAEDKKKVKFKYLNEKSLKDVWGNIEHTINHIIGIPEGEDKDKWAYSLFEEKKKLKTSLTRERKRTLSSRKHKKSQTNAC